jgi:hypothetical protein
LNFPLSSTTAIRQKQTSAQARRIGALSAEPPLAFLFRVDFVSSHSESRQRAQSRSAKSPLRALAAGKMLRVRELRCCCAAVKSAIHARRGETNPTSPQISVR